METITLLSDSNFKVIMSRYDSRPLSHILEPRKEGVPHTPAICGKGWGAKGHPSIVHVMFPSVTSLPTCRQCRERFLTSIGVEVDAATGYPVGHTKATV